MKKGLLLAVFAVLASALALPVPDKPPYTNKISVKVAEPGIPLDNVIRMAAKSAGVNVLTKNLPQGNVVLNLKDIPFKRFLDMILRVYAPEHSYTLLPEGIVFIGPKSEIGEEASKPLNKQDSKVSVGEISVLIPAKFSGEDLLRVAKDLGAEKSVYVPSARVLILSGPASLVEWIAPLLREVEKNASLNASLNKPSQGQKTPDEKDASLKTGEGGEKNLEQNIDSTISSKDSPPPLPSESDRILPDKTIEVVESALPREIFSSLAKTYELEVISYLGNGKFLVRGFTDSISSFKNVVRNVESASSNVTEIKIFRSTLPKEALENLAKVLGVQLIQFEGYSYLIRGDRESIEAFEKGIGQVGTRSTPIITSLPKGVPASVAKAALLGVLPDAKVDVQEGFLLIAPPVGVSSKDVADLVNKILNNLTPSKDEAKEMLMKSYPIYGNPEEITKGLEVLYPLKVRESMGYRMDVLKESKTLVVVAPYDVHERVVQFLKEADPPTSATKQKSTRVRVSLTKLTAEDAVNALKKTNLKVAFEADPLGKAIWVEGDQTEVARAQAYLKLIDVKPPQVKLAVKVTQIERSALSQMDPSIQIALQGLGVQISGNGLGIGYSLPANVTNALNLTIQTLEGRGLARTLIDTQTLVLDGAEAKLNSGGTLYVLQTPTTENGQGGGTQNTQASSGFGGLEYGLVLKLKPTIYSDKEVEIATGLELGSLPSQGPVANTVDVPKKTIEGVLRLREGNTGLLGGLIYQEDGQKEQGIPFLSSIPLIGNLFKISSSSKKETVLLVLISPTQIEMPDVPHILSLEEDNEGKNFDGKSAEDPRTPPFLSKPSTEATQAEPSTEVTQAKTSQVAQSVINNGEISRTTHKYIALVLGGNKNYQIYISGSGGSVPASLEQVFGIRATGEKVALRWEAQGENVFGGGKTAIYRLNVDGEYVQFLLYYTTQTGTKGELLIGKN